MTHADDIKKALKSKKIVIGTKEVLKNLKLGKLAKVYLTANAPESVKESVNRYAGLGKVEIVQLKYANDELGVLCKKPYGISILGFIK